MKALVIGLGSMGKRRIRCLKALGISNILGFDPRHDRRVEAKEKYGIDILNEFDVAAARTVDFFIVSVPPAVHKDYMVHAIELRKHFFVEASVIDDGLNEIGAKSTALNLIAAPSATLLFHPAVKKITELVASGRLGRLSNFTYHSGQYLPDWHTYEKVSDYYVSKKETGGAREIVPFELSWLTKCFGFPKGVFANVKKTIDIQGAESIDDCYNLSLDFGNYLGLMTVDVVSRAATRSLLINGSEGQLRWDWNNHSIQLYSPRSSQWETIGYEQGKAAAGYNPNIAEQMYIDEVQAFLDSIKGPAKFPNTLLEDARILSILTAAESSSQSRKEISL